MTLQVKAKTPARCRRYKEGLKKETPRGSEAQFFPRKLYHRGNTGQVRNCISKQRRSNGDTTSSGSRIPGRIEFTILDSDSKCFYRVCGSRRIDFTTSESGRHLINYSPPIP